MAAAGVIFKVLTTIPWGQVIDNAPKVAEGATKLWQSVGGKRKKDDAAAPPHATAMREPGAAPLAATEAAALRAQLQMLETEVRQLHEQMQASTALIKALAEQNAQLVQRVELHRKRLRQWAWASGAGLLLLLVLLASGWRG